MLMFKSSAKYIIGTGTNDDVGVGIVCAFEVAKCTQYVVVGG